MAKASWPVFEKNAMKLWKQEMNVKPNTINLLKRLVIQKYIFLGIILVSAILLFDFQYMELKKKNTNIDEIKEKLKKYYKLYVSTGV